ncbi:MAG: hypothetical protein PHE17_08315 [Thiothrix sp.]|uniref:ATP-grasp domain-containing protein n=1 Tax=Thiothrix sp. TaxID=1032 RepID=UPI002603C123|nr:hypothetical protein [Thiothrix sp.]MDD5393004.1 hypothetical protein [Thiothrix sp.]
MLLLAGGDADLQILRLLRYAARMGIAVDTLLTGQSGLPCLRWDIKAHRLVDGKREIKPKAAFIRQDVFGYLKSNNPQDQIAAREWYATVAGWLLASPDVKVFNRLYLGRGGVNKPHVLHLALSVGLDIADTGVTNDGTLMDRLAATHDWIGKPVTGGAHCEELAVSGWAFPLSHPQIVQRKLQQPEMRVFRVGDAWFGFWVVSDALDYRTSATTRLEQTTVPAELQDKMGKLSDCLGLDFAAADFKTDPARGKLQFLEINTNPMFAGFDQAADGALCEAMLDWLLA